jgi:hypothetical protein
MYNKRDIIQNHNVRTNIQLLPMIVMQIQLILYNPRVTQWKQTKQIVYLNSELA